MPRITRANAREHLQKILQLFSKITGEAVGAAFTWGGQVNLAGCESFREFGGKHKDEIWRALISSVHPARQVKEEVISNVENDRIILNLLSEGDFSKLNVYTLRQMIVWLTRRTTGKCLHVYRVTFL